MGNDCLAFRLFTCFEHVSHLDKLNVFKKVSYHDKLELFEEVV